MHRRIVTWGIALLGVAALSGLAVAAANTVSTAPEPASVSHRPRANEPAGPAGSATAVVSTPGTTGVNARNAGVNRDGTPNSTATTTATSIDDRGRDSTTSTSVDDHGGGPSTATTVDNSGRGKTPDSTTVSTTTPGGTTGKGSNDPGTIAGESGRGRG